MKFRDVVIKTLLGEEIKPEEYQKNLEEEVASAHDRWQADWDSHRSFGKLSHKGALKKIKAAKAGGTYKPNPHNPYPDAHSGHKPDAKTVAAHKKQGTYNPD